MTPTFTYYREGLSWCADHRGRLFALAGSFCHLLYITRKDH